MKAKEYLKSLKRYDVMINQKLQEQEELRSLLTSIEPIDLTKERVQGGKQNFDKMGDIIAKVVELEHEIDNEIDMFVDSKHKIINQIQSLNNVVHMQILYKRYVQYKKLEEIAIEMGYAYQWVRELHGHALLDFEKLLK